MKVGGADLRERVLVVAECGNNHEGSLDVAKQLVCQAAAAGVDAVKFQTFVTERFTGPEDPARVARLKGFELPPGAFRELAVLAAAEGVLFLSTPLDLESVAVLDGLVPAFKIASGDNTFYPLLDAVADTGKPVLLSTGLLALEEVRSVKERIEARWTARGAAPLLIPMHCVCSYPVPDEEANVSAVTALREAFGDPVGYSDHTLGIDAAVLAVALGARVVEKHFTLDKNFSDFRDHQLSAEPSEMAELVRRLRRAERLLGDGEKRLMPCEEAMPALVRRSLVATQPLRTGNLLQPDDVCFVRPAGPIAPGQEDSVLGKKLVRDVAAGQRITPQDVATP